ncbi:MAG: hypothetical protein KA758_01485 [Acidimicrobiales bacterium]|nr:hypothetical protein [Acidimicrobiales bacterium]
MGRLDEDPACALSDAFESWCEDNDLDPDETDIEDYHEAMAELDTRIGEDEYRRPY